MSVYEVDRLMAEARRLAVEYRNTTGKTLPLTAELAVNDAIRLLQLEAVTDPQCGYDAIRRLAEKSAAGAQAQAHAVDVARVLIKGRAIFDPARSGLRIGQIRWEGPWDTVAVVLMDENFEPVEIYEADREALAEALDPNGPEAGQGGRKGGITLARFRVLGELVWDYANGLRAE